MEPLKKEEIINEELLSDALGGAKIISFKSEPAVAKGEHYLSTLLRVKVTFQKLGKELKEETKLIVKTYPEGLLKGFCIDSDLLVRELMCYNNILPRLSEKLGRNLTPIPLGSYKTDVLILEDLNLKGYKMAKRTERMDFKHCAASVKTLAAFHASSIIAKNEDPTVFDEIKKETIYVHSNVIQQKFTLNGFRTLADEFENIPHLQHYCNRLRLTGEKTWNSVVEAAKSRDNEINVLNHGDFWTTNILFRYDNQNNIDDTKLVDFQFSRWTSPAMDLTMFFVTSVRNQDDVPKLTSIYLDHLNSYFDQNIISAEVLETSLKRFHCFGLFLAVCTMPICILDPKNCLNFENFTKDDFLVDFKDSQNPYQACRDKRYQEIVPEFLDFYIKIGLL